MSEHEERPSDEDKTEREETVQDLEAPEGQTGKVVAGKLVINGHENIGLF